LTNYAEAVLSISEEDNRDLEEEDEGFEDTENTIDPTIPALVCPPTAVPQILPIPSSEDYERMPEDTLPGRAVSGISGYLSLKQVSV